MKMQLVKIVYKLEMRNRMIKLATKIINPQFKN